MTEEDFKDIEIRRLNSRLADMILDSAHADEVIKHHKRIRDAEFDAHVRDNARMSAANRELKKQLAAVHKVRNSLANMAKLLEEHRPETDVDVTYLQAFVADLDRALGK